MEGVLSLSPEDRHLHLIKRVADFEKIWVLHNEEEGYALNEEKNGKKYLPVWPFKEYSDTWIKDDFSNFASKEIDIYAFKDEMLDKLKQNKIGILSFPAKEIGLKIEIEKFRKDLTEELEEYE